MTSREKQNQFYPIVVRQRRLHMGFRFQGFFSDGDEALMTAALSRWPFCTAKTIAAPFCGFGLRAPDCEREADSDDEYERLLELSFAMKRGLAEFSNDFPAATFVLIDADCFGGTCLYTGFVAQAGTVSFGVTEMQPGAEQLQRLLWPLGVQLQSGYFAPFTRGYW